MKLTFIPAPGSPCRVTSADDPQPEESWSPQAPNKRIAAPAAPRTQTDAAPASSSATEHPSDSSPVGTAAPDFLEPLPPGSCPDCPDRPLLFQARQQANYYRAMFRAAKQREATKDARIAGLEAEIRVLKQRLYGSKSESRHAADQPRTPIPQDPLAEDASPAEAGRWRQRLGKPQRQGWHPRRGGLPV